jgi:hypothetical protein
MLLGRPWLIYAKVGGTIRAILFNKKLGAETIKP